VIESIKCQQEGVLRSVADANIGSVLGIGAPSWTGGFLQFVNTYGVDAFRARATQLAEDYGPRFSPPAILARMAGRAETFQ
jgi:3-hydroxyacyl-CoA dehydrogenase/enoyl-CoA hydratase/3-hydroxybutyryl-CoA epimerase